MDDIARFIAEIEADISDFERDIHKAMAMAENLPDDVEVELKATINDLKQKLMQAEALAKQYESNDAIKDLKANIADLQQKLAMANAQANAFESDTIEKRVELETGLFKAELVALQARLAAFEANKVEKKIDLDTNAFKRGLVAIDKALNSYSDKMDALANDIRTTGTVAANVFKGMFLSSITALVPAIASVVPALMAVMNAIGVVGGGALGLANAFAITGAGVVGFGAMAISALKMVENGTLSVTKEVQKYQSAVDDLKSAWTGVVSQNQSAIFNTLANGVNTAKVALQGLTPFLSGVAQGME
ncbi:hypothetical protein [Staphylococcus simulans]|uniref:hypothetical protein n=1 Tax=Staphylococcus simulans TaxID=1286 RepID=UPI0021D01C86|nr:hypothetical protein [Staphylococcus simulans]UXV43452.1 hypothetical protein MUA12_05805 [Staphylococcus simulans]